MKALTLSQPYATLVAYGQKKIETRSFSTSYRGPLAIHAAKGYPDRGLRFEEPFYRALWDAGIKPDMALPTGAIVAVCDLVGCMKTEDVIELSPFEYIRGQGRGSYAYTLTDHERAFGDYTAGRWGWLLANVRALPTPILARGALGVWEWDGQVTP